MEENIKVMPYFMIYTADFKVLKDKLSDKEIVEILNAISDLCLYAETDFVPSNKFQEIWFNKLKDDFLKNLAKYKTCIANGSKGGRPKKPKENPKETQEKPIGFLQVIPKQNPDETNKIKENKIKENIIKNNSEYINNTHTSYGEFDNVYLTERQKNEFDCLVLNKEVANNIINELSENIASNREKIFNEEYPDMHFIRLKKYWQNYKKRPKDIKVTSEDIHRLVYGE